MFSLVLALLMTPSPAFSHDFALVAEVRRVSLSEAVEIVKRRTGGQVLSASSEGASYRIKVLTPSGEVLVLEVDAGTGAVR